MTTSKRAYTMGARERAAEQAREAILDEAVNLFTTHSFDEVTIARVAAAAGVSGQTVTNHFGSKHNLYLAGVAERVSPQNKALRATAVVGDVASIVAANTAGYEMSGQSTVDMLSQIDKHPTLAETSALGRQAFRDWVSEVFEPQLSQAPASRRGMLLRLLMVQLDVYSWYQLRVLDGHSQKQVQDDLTSAVEAILASR